MRDLPTGLIRLSPIKRRKRRTNAEMAELFNAVVAVLNGYGNDRISIRHLCYRLSSTGVIPKMETAFDTLGNHLANWRKQGRIPFGRFVDATRWYHGSTTFDNAAEALEDPIAGYRKNLWRPQPFHVEVWVEKEAVASIVVPVADHWGIKTFVCRGFLRSHRRGKLPRHLRKPFGTAKILSSFTLGIMMNRVTRSTGRFLKSTSSTTAFVISSAFAESPSCQSRSRNSICRPAPRKRNGTAGTASRSTHCPRSKSARSLKARSRH